MSLREDSHLLQLNGKTLDEIYVITTCGPNNPKARERAVYKEYVIEDLSGIEFLHVQAWLKRVLKLPLGHQANRAGAKSSGGL